MPSLRHALAQITALATSRPLPRSHAQEDTDNAEVLRRIADLATAATRDLDTAPRTWSLPPEPGPEVKAVRCACCAVRWTRTRRNGWSHDLWVPHNGGEIHGRYWRALVVDHTNLDHPLTDATETGANQ